MRISSPAQSLLTVAIGFSLFAASCQAGSSGGNSTGGSGGSGEGGGASEGGQIGSGGGAGADATGGKSSGGSGGVSTGTGGNSGGSGGSATGGTAAGGTAAGGSGGTKTGGAGGTATGGSGGTAVVGCANGETPVFVAVGNNRRRIRSLDLGKTWVDESLIADNDGMASVAFGAGVFATGGHGFKKTYYTANGKDWTENPALDQWIGGIAWGNDRFVAVGGYGSRWFSTTGKSWTKGSNKDTDAARTLAFGDGKFMAATDQGNWYSSTDGNTWTLDSPGHTTANVIYCSGKKMFVAQGSVITCDSPEGRGRSAAFGAGVWVVANGGRLSRSENNGAAWTAIAGAGMDLEGVAFGCVK
jgi:hypothetical protein